MTKHPGTPARQAAVLAAFRTTASVTRACKVAEVARRQHYAWLAEDADYAQAFETAKDEAAQMLEDEAVRRAYRGWDEPVVFQGNFTYPPKLGADGMPQYDRKGRLLLDGDKPVCIRKHSDALLMFLLKAWRPTKYRENWKGEISLPPALALTQERLKKLSDEELDTLRRLTRILTESQAD